MCILQVHLAIYSFANNQISSALQVLYRSRYLLLLSFGEQHPDVALVDVSISYQCLISKMNLQLQHFMHRKTRRMATMKKLVYLT